MDKRVLVDACADQESPPVVAPLVLQVAAVDVDALCHVVVVAYGHIVEVVVFQSGCEFGGHEQQPIKRMDVLSAGHCHQIACASVGVGVFLAAVIA